MPRPLRIEYEGARYHVMCRSNRGAMLFEDDGDAQLYLDTLSEAVSRTDWRIHAYALMGTHYHLLLETPFANLVEGMKWFQGTFTQRMNARKQTWGHLFQGRYKAKVIDDDEPDYFEQVGDYIHLNPASANLLSMVGGEPRLETYRHSSYPCYLRTPSRRPDWLVVEEVLAHHRLRDTPAGRRAYGALMHEKTLRVALSKLNDAEQRVWKSMTRGWVHGQKAFRDRMLEFLREQKHAPVERVYDAGQKRDLTESAILQCLDQGCKHLEIRPEALPDLKKSDKRKLLLASYIKKHYSIPNRWISQTLCMGHPSMVGNCTARVRRDARLLRSYRRLEKSLQGL